jgi:selenocysteine-specific elongation factor
MAAWKRMRRKSKLRLLGRSGGLSWADLVMRSNQLPSKLKSLVDNLVSQGGILRFDGERLRYLHPQVMAGLKRFSLDYLKEFHQKNPLQGGAMKEELKSKLPPQVDPSSLTIFYPS